MSEYAVHPLTRVFLVQNEHRRISMNYKMFYDSLNSKVLDEHQLKMLNFPMQGEERGRAILHNLPHPHCPTVPGENLRKCSFCQTVYQVNDEDLQPIGTVCVYHDVKSFNFLTGKHACCGQFLKSSGCQKRGFHVTEDIDPNNLINFVNSEVDGLEARKIVYTLDCEFVFTKKGQELASIVMIDQNEREVLNIKVMPESPILDYVTKLSGLSASDFVTGGVMKHSMYVKKLRSLVGPNVILVGHGLKEDLLRMGLIHNKVVDTSVLYPHRISSKTNSLTQLWNAHFTGQRIGGSNKALIDCKKTLRLAKKAL